MEGEEVDWMYHDITIEITKPSHSKEILDITRDGTYIHFNYKANQVGQYIISAYYNRYKDNESAIDVKIFEAVRWSWDASDEFDGNLETNIIRLDGDINENKGYLPITGSRGLSTQMKGSIIPYDNLNYDLGAPQKIWNNAYIRNLRGTADFACNLVNAPILTNEANNTEISITVGGRTSNRLSVNYSKCSLHSDIARCLNGSNNHFYSLIYIEQYESHKEDPSKPSYDPYKILYKDKNDSMKYNPVTGEFNMGYVYLDPVNRYSLYPKESGLLSLGSSEHWWHNLFVENIYTKGSLGVNELKLNSYAWSEDLSATSQVVVTTAIVKNNINTIDLLNTPHDPTEDNIEIGLEPIYDESSEITTSSLKIYRDKVTFAENELAYKSDYVSKIDGVGISKIQIITQDDYNLLTEINETTLYVII